jgi:hypothetical protein
MSAAAWVSCSWVCGVALLLTGCGRSGPASEPLPPPGSPPTEIVEPAPALPSLPQEPVTPSPAPFPDGGTGGPQGPPGSTQWIRFPDAYPATTTVDARGRLFVLSPGQHLLGLTSAGVPFLDVPALPGMRYLGMTALPKGEELLIKAELQGPECEQRGCVQSLVWLRGDGAAALDSVRIDDGSVAPLAVRADGAVVEWVGFTDRGVALRLRHRDGTLGAPHFTYQELPMWVTAARFDAEGNLLLAGRLDGLASVQGHRFGAPDVSRGLLLKFDPAGTLLWGANLPSNGELVGVGATADGAVVALGRFDTSFRFAGRAVALDDRVTVLLAWEADGRERLAYKAGGGRHPVALGVDPAGRAYIAHYAAGCETNFDVIAYDLRRRTSLWRRDFGVPSCLAEGVGVHVSGGAPVVVGLVQGTSELAPGLVPPFTPRFSLPFILKLRP